MSHTDRFYEKIDTALGADYMLRAGEGVPENGVAIRPHVHLEHEIMWFRRARGAFSIGSEKFSLQDNTLVFVGSMVLHDMELEYSGDHQRFLLQYPQAVHHRLKYPFPLGDLQAGFVLQLNPQQAERLQFLFTWFSELHAAPQGTEQIDPLLVLLLNTVYGCGEQAEKVIVRGEKTGPFDTLIDFVVWLEHQQRFTVSLSEAAARCGLSTSHFSRTFKKIMQIGFKEYLIRKKIAQSAGLLRNSDLSITDVAYRCDFTDSAYYCYKFKALMGVSPKTFRQHSRTTRQLSSCHDVAVLTPPLSE